MRLRFTACLIVLILAGCSSSPATGSSGEIQLTPYVTETGLTVVDTPITEDVPTAAPTLTPTPLIHTVALNETISSIALKYGLDTATVLASNPTITPSALTVGTQLIIPGGGTVPAQASVVSEPLKLIVSEPDCYETIEGGLWCVVLVDNPLDENAIGITVTFSLKNDAGETIQEQAAPALLNQLSPGNAIPVAAYFSPPVSMAYLMNIELTTALPVDSSALEYIPLEAQRPSVDIQGRMAVIRTEILLGDDVEEADSIWAAAVAYDRQGRVVGLRRVAYTIQMTVDGTLPVEMYVYSNGEDIQKVDILAEAIILDQ